MKASGYFKVYINSCLKSLNCSELGFKIGPMTITAVCVADDIYILSDSVSGLQAAINIINHFGKRYQLTFNPSKTKIVVTGSKVDMEYFKDTSPWTLNDKVISVVDSNDHLGLLVAGLHEEQQNIDQN